MNIQLYSWYDHFTLTQKPKYINWTHDYAPVKFFSDVFVKRPDIRRKDCALLIEPRSIQPQIYNYMETHYKKFQYVFTHDSILLSKIPNGKQIYWGGVYEFNDIPKTKDISMVSSNKQMCNLHICRLEWAKRLENEIDCMGTYNGGNMVDTKTIYAPYRFSVVVENYIDDYWFSEKICNCFANKTIPIYVGARKISEIFNENGIFECRDFKDIKTVIDFIKKVGAEREYNDRLDAINDNYERVKAFTCFEDTFYNMHKDLLESL